jgi:hypothetical protein
MYLDLIEGEIRCTNAISTIPYLWDIYNAAKIESKKLRNAQFFDSMLRYRDKSNFNRLRKEVRNRNNPNELGKCNLPIESSREFDRN